MGYLRSVLRGGDQRPEDLARQRAQRVAQEAARERPATVASARTRAITPAGASPAHGPGSAAAADGTAPTAPATCGAAWLVPV